MYVEVGEENYYKLPVTSIEQIINDHKDPSNGMCTHTSIITNVDDTNPKEMKAYLASIWVEKASADKIYEESPQTKIDGTYRKYVKAKGDMIVNGITSANKKELLKSILEGLELCIEYDELRFPKEMLYNLYHGIKEAIYLISPSLLKRDLAVNMRKIKLFFYNQNNYR